MRFIFLCICLLLSSAASAKQLWLDNNWDVTTEAKAVFYIEYDDTAVKADGPHPIKIYYADSKQLRFEGQMKDPSDPSGTDQVGPYKFYHANGQLDSDGEFDEDGQFTGLTRIFNEDGTLNRTMEMKAGKVTGEVRYFNSEGKLYSSYQLVGDMKQGPYKRFANDGTTVIESGQYKNDKKDGEFRSYYDNGKVRLVSHYTMGELDGDYMKYAKDGHLKEQRPYRNGKVNGLNTRYRGDGSKYWSGTYVDGQLDGVSREWDPDGHLIRERQYSKAKKDGLSQSWDQDGMLTYVEHYQDDQLVGEKISYFKGTEQVKTKEQYNDKHQKLSSITYDEDGTKRSETTYDVTHEKPTSTYRRYENGHLVFERQKDPNRNWSFEQTYDEHGEVIGFVTYKDRRKDGKYLATNTSFDDDSKQFRTEANFKQGIYHGEYKETLLPDNIVLQKGRYEEYEKVGEWYYREGDRIRTEHYDANGKLHGELLATTLDGKLLRREHYQHGKPVGEFENRTPEGDVIAKGQYVDGSRHGDWIISDQWYSADKIWHGTFNHGEKIGKWYATDFAGYVVATEQYDQQGRRQGKFYEFSSNGALRQVESYRDDKLDGKQIDYMLGEAFFMYIYENGHLVEERSLESHDDG